ncbi:MAG: hypothetical protein H0S80_14745 [Desulfovibrionaceae bacterium]|nr:hypothetical protein [Desulfovibrionaceae bacterium]
MAKTAGRQRVRRFFLRLVSRPSNRHTENWTRHNGTRQGAAPPKAAEQAENLVFQRSDLERNAGKGISRMLH